LKNLIYNNLTETAMLRRQERMAHGTDILFRVQTVRRSVVRMIDFYDMSNVPAALDGIAALTVELDRYIDESVQQKNKDLGNAAKEILDRYIVLINEFIALVEARSIIIADVSKQDELTNDTIFQMIGETDQLINDGIKVAENAANLTLTSEFGWIVKPLY
jgi:hypothetical protein